MQQDQQAPFQRKSSHLEETLQNFIKVTQSSFDHVNKNHETMSRNHDALIKNLEMRIGQLSRQIVILPSYSGGFTCNTVDNPKNESYKIVETYFGFITENDEDEIVKEDVIEKEESKNQGDQEARGFTLDQLIDKNSPWRRTKK